MEPVSHSHAHYFVPAPSYWPLLGSAALFCLALGAALAVNGLGAGRPLLGVGVLLLLWMLFGWFGDVIRENLKGVYRGRRTCRFAGAWRGSFFPR